MGSTDRCALAVRAHRLLLDRQLQHSPSTARVVRLQDKLDALVSVLTAAERAYYVEQIGLLGRDWHRRSA